MGVISRFRNKKNGKVDKQEKKFTELIASKAGKNLFVSFGDRQIIMHNPRTPFITLYRGSFDVKQKGKTAVLEDNQRKTIKLVDFSLQEIENGYKIDFFAKGYNVQVELTQLESKLVISANSNYSFEKVKLSFKRSQEEKLIGLGESKSYNLLNNCINCYPLGDGGHNFSTIVKDYISKNKKTSSYLSVIDSIISSNQYFIKVNEPLFQAIFEENFYHILAPKAPKQLEFYFLDDIQGVYNTLSSIYPNKQSIPERLQQGFIITERINKLEKTLKVLNNEKIPATATLIKDIDWQPEQIKALETIATRYGHRLILRTFPYAIVGNKDFQHYSNQDLLIKSLNGDIYVQRIEGKDQAFIDLTKPLAIKYYKEKLAAALKYKKVIGFCAECEYPLPLDADYKGEDVKQLRTIWLKLFQKTVWEAASEQQEKILLFRGVCAETSQYGIALTEAKLPNNSTAFGLHSVLPSMVSLASSGAGLAISEIGGANNGIVKYLSVPLFKEWTKLGILSPIMLFSDNTNKLILKNKHFIFALMKKREMLLPLINNQLELIAKGLPAIAPSWLLVETQETTSQAVYFGEHLQIYTENERFKIRYKKNANWETLLI